MRTPQDAIAEILRRTPTPKESERLPLRKGCGRILAEEVLSDVDLPPFEKSAMDGFAVRSADLTEPGVLRQVGESRAGAGFSGRVGASECVAIYTGAELPPECDAVVMVEETRTEGESVHFERGTVSGANVSHRGEILESGRGVLSPGLRLTPEHLAVLAAVGCDPVPVFPRLRVSILTTGDELVPASVRPGPGQIREGNTLYLATAAERLGIEVLQVGIVADDERELLDAFARALDEGDALITTGGVSMGKYDLVGAAFEKLGVEPILHKVAIKPGKPIWFGMRGRKPVFGLPGNPVSSLLGFEVFVRPALARLAGAGEGEQSERLGRARWMGPATKQNWRQQNLPASLRHGADGTLELHPFRWMGSADIVGVARAQALAVVPPEAVLATGDVVDFRPL